MELVRSEEELARTKENLCPACGSGSGDTVLCPVCGKLISEGFQPLDAIRSSYNMQRKSLAEDALVLPEAFQSNRTIVRDTAWACNVYSMVPYLGILFLPLALAVGSFGYVDAQRKNEVTEVRFAIRSIILSLVLLAAQLLLWWLLYVIPEIGI